MKTKKQIHDNMSKIKGKDTSIELLLRKALYHEGYRYRKNDRTLPGCPDIVLTKYRIAIFCDGDFFHGYDFPKIKKNLKRNREYWEKKISDNQKRDMSVDEQLVSLHYLVYRFWEHEIKENLPKVLHEIELGILDQERKLEFKE